MNPSIANKPGVNSLLKDIAYTSVLSLITGVLAALGFAMLVMITSAPAQAELQPGDKTAVDQLPRMSIDQVQQGSLLLKLASGGVSVDAPLLHTDVSMRVSGMVNRVQVTQQFHNPGDEWVEGTYVFPLPENSAVDHLKMRIGERIIEGEIKEKGEAKKIYNQAKREGKRASLLSQQRPNIFTTAVANIGPGEKVEVIIEYQQVLHYDVGRFSLRFPMVVAPRYIPGRVIEQEEVTAFSGNGWAQNTDQVPDAAEITPPVVDPTEPKVNPVTMEIRLDAGFPLAHIESRFHPVTIENHTDGYHLIRLEPGVPADRDFELIWTPQIDQMPKGALFNEQWQGDDYSLLMIMPPATDQISPITQPREVIFVVDTSGSMHGTSLAQAKSALSMALSRLKPNERFNVIQFNSNTHALFGQAVPASPKNLRKARGYVNLLEADGGTEMLSALRRALTGEQDESVLRQVVFLTDGSVGNEEKLFSTIQQRLGSSRLFTVGIGSAPNSFFMTRAANFGRGSFTYIGDVAEVKQKMSELFSKLESPVLTDIQVAWPEGAEVEMWPARIPDLYLGEPVVLAAKLPKGGTSVEITGRINGQQWQQQVKLAGGAKHEGVRVIWARRKIADLMDRKAQGEPESEIRPAVLAVALKHHLVSRYTSLVAVDKTPVRPVEENLQTKPLPTNLPQGWSAKKVFGSMPQTATPAPLHLLLGLFSLLGSLLLGWSKKVLGKRTDHSIPVKSAMEA
ncbi:MAG: marine proteobacterial sortase target protein [Chromatiales bacterium]|nr:marine proteobacterial sortase target protein [Chromatiales bacterium]